MDEAGKQRVLDLADIAVSNATGLFAVASESMPLYVGHMERLLLLNGGSLTLSFTVIAALSSHLVRDHTTFHLWSLIWAWRLLVLSMLGCVYHNAVAINAFVHGKMYERIASAQVHQQRLQVAAGQQDTSGTLQQDKDRSLGLLLRAARNCRYVYNGSHVLTLIAFALLLHFVTVNAEAVF